MITRVCYKSYKLKKSRTSIIYIFFISIKKKIPQKLQILNMLCYSCGGMVMSLHFHGITGYFTKLEHDNGKHCRYYSRQSKGSDTKTRARCCRTPPPCSQDGSDMYLHSLSFMSCLAECSRFILEKDRTL